jgi:hypothetical protein
MAFLIYVVASNVLNFGETLYEGGLIKVGFLGGARLYAFTLFIGFWPLTFTVLKLKSFEKILFIFTYVLSAIVILVLFRRTAILILFSTTIFFFILNFKRYFKLVLAGTLVGLITFFSVGSYITVGYEARGGSERLGAQNIQNEGRFREIVLVFNRIKKSPEELIFGTGNLFNDRGDYGDAYWGKSRRIHGDFSALLYGIGVLGLAGFLIYLFQLYVICLKNKIDSKLRYLRLSVLFIFTFTLFTAGIYYYTYCAVFMFLIGYFSNPCLNYKPYNRLIKYV